MPCEKLNEGPPFNAMKVLPKSSNVRLMTLPFGPGTVLSILPFSKTER
jgi:hypothetical protein